MTPNATQTQRTPDDPPEFNPPPDIMPAEGGASPLVPSAAVIERLRMLANDVASARLNIGGCSNAGALLYKMMLGYEHGIRPMTALGCIDIIEGRGCLNAQALAATVEARGLGKIDVIEVDDDRCVVNVRRADWADGATKQLIYGKEDAFAAGFLSPDEQWKVKRDPKTGAAVSTKKNWRTNHQDMYVARARSRAYRRHFETASLGLTYSREELEDQAEDNGRAPSVELEKTLPPWQQPTIAQAAPTPAGGSLPSMPEPSAAPQATAIPPAEPAPLASPSPDAAPLASPAQLQQAKALNQVLQIPQVKWQALLAAHRVKSFKDLRKDAAQSILDHLDRLRQIGILRKWTSGGGVSDEQWARALTKRNVTDQLDLKPEDVQQIYSKLYNDVTPFKRIELGIDPKPADALGNVPTPPPIAAAA